MNSDLSSASENNENSILHHDEGTILARAARVNGQFIFQNTRHTAASVRANVAVTELSLCEWHIWFASATPSTPSTKEVGQGLTGKLFCKEKKNESDVQCTLYQKVFLHPQAVRDSGAMEQALL